MAGARLADALVARCTFPAPGTSVTCAVSGGADSSALLVLAVTAGCDVTAVHVDHGLRPGSAAEAEVVRSTAARFGAAFRAVRVAVAPGPGLEARARHARYAALPCDVLTGHTADDQAETVLLNLLRGSATRGLAGMRPDTARHGVRRPILALRRAETVALCTSLAVDVVDDPSNADPTHTRNRIRAELLPRLCDVGGRDVVPILARQADLLREDDDLLSDLAASLDPTDARALTAAPPPLARRAVRRWLAAADPLARPVDSAAVQRVLEVAAGHSSACDVGEGRRVHRSRQQLTVSLDTGEVPHGSARSG